MKLIVGLGNPGVKYHKTWHNMGFLALDEMARVFDFEKFKKNEKFKAEISEGRIGEEKIILAKPMTYMNKSGEAVQALKSFYKLTTDDIIIVHDDIDSELGKIKTVTNSGSGGHNGIKSIIEMLGTKDFTRIKLGVKTDKREKMEASDYVLGRFGIFNRGKVKEVIEKAVLAMKAALK